MIKTVEEILFSSFVVPSCIDDLDSPIVGKFNKLTVAGFGQVSGSLFYTLSNFLIS